jgi:hypothetical protein
VTDGVLLKFSVGQKRTKDASSLAKGVTRIGEERLVVEATVYGLEGQGLIPGRGRTFPLLHSVH